MASPEPIISLFHHRWTVPILAELQRRSGVKFVYLVRGMGISRDSARRTLDALIKKGLVRRNPGYGHPMRPEYILTARGARIAPWCARLMAAFRRLDIEEVALRKWTMPVLASLVPAGSGRRFSEIQSALPGLTPRALALALKDAAEAGLLERRVIGEYPPTALYRLTARGGRLRPILSARRRA